MILDKNKIKDRHDALMAAFRDNDFRNELESVKNDLKAWLEEWIGGMRKLDPRISNVFSIESRVKGEKTFEEKLYRKNYINDWDVFNNIEENQALIMHELTDLIGLRINCHFVIYEKEIYDYFISTSEQYVKKGFSFNFGENTKQKNGNTIYKFSGIYNDKYHFEIQIKSIVHNVWGEVEHKTVYKNPTYDGFIEQKKLISKTLHDVMLASDKELHTLFNMQETEEQLLRSLFFCKTCKTIAEQCKTDVLGEHYNSYFRAFPDIEPIKKYLINVYQGEGEYFREEKHVVTDDFYRNLSHSVQSEFPDFFLSCLYNIDSILNVHQGYDAFIIYFLQQVIKRDGEDFDDDFNESFNDQDEDVIAEEDKINDYLTKIDEILGNCRINKGK